MPLAFLIRVKIDLHLHTDRSFDGSCSPEEAVHTAVARGLDKIAITDHDTIEGAILAQRDYPDRVIVGEEISCLCGTHLIGLFLTEQIPRGLTIEETAERIREQGGLVYGPHPFAYLTKASWRAIRLAEVADIVEAFNSRAFLPKWNRYAARLASKTGLPAAASSDAHFPWELGRAYTELPEFSTADELREALKEAQPHGVRTGSPWVHVASAAVARVRWVKGKRQRGPALLSAASD